VFDDPLAAANVTPAQTWPAPASVSRKRDIKQFRQACKEVGLTAEERYKASEALHAEKQASAKGRHMSYGELLAWLQQWREH
jgi:hypothetical protein